MKSAEKERLKEGKAADEDISPKHVEDAQEVDDDDDVQWQTDTSREAKSKANGNVKSENPQVEKKNLAHEMKKYLKKGSPISELKTFISSPFDPPQEVMDTLFNALFDGVGKEFAKEVTKKKNYLAAASE